MKKFIALVLVLAFLNLVIAPEFASAVVNGLDLAPALPVAAAAGPIILGAVVVIAGLVYLATKSGGQETKKPEEQKPEDINRTIENLQPRSENDCLETTHVAKSDGLPVTQSGEFVILK